ncbi:vitamin K epoxide reductase family protein [Emticicia soli]|uniref:Vitamin K epoxide reductase family protein n=1 Tax=Emticicia soli TaxID=2027878 RepID=A0ABW5J532_9BACT
MKLTLNEKNAFEALLQVIKLSKVKVTTQSLKRAFHQHPYATTLIGLSDILAEFKVANLATRLLPEQLNQIPLPAIAYFEGNGGTFVTVTKAENDTIEWRHEKEGIIKEPIHEFMFKWHGITLIVEPDESSGELDYSKKRKEEILETLRIPFVITVLIACLGIILYKITKQYNFEENGPLYTLLLTKFIGIIVSGMLVWYSIDTGNSFLKSVCQFNSKSNCNNILSSNAAKLFGWLSWADIGLLYFTGSFLTILLFHDAATYTLLQYLGVSAGAYTFWSVYYQFFIAKEWCPLCMAVQVLLWLELAMFIQTGFSASSILSEVPIGVLITFLLPVILLVVLKKPLQQALQIDTMQNELQKLKFDSDYLNTLFTRNTSLTPFIAGMQAIEIGNTHAANKLTLVLSPTCNSCFYTYLAAKQLSEQYADIHVQIVLAVRPLEKDTATEVARIILSQETKEEMAGALNAWFTDNSQNLSKWKKVLKIKEINEKSMLLLSEQLKWLEIAGIYEAPSKFLNGNEIPKFYKGSDIVKLYNIYTTEYSLPQAAIQN